MNFNTHTYKKTSTLFVLVIAKTRNQQIHSRPIHYRRGYVFLLPFFLIGIQTAFAQETPAFQPSSKENTWEFQLTESEKKLNDAFNIYDDLVIETENGLVQDEKNSGDYEALIAPQNHITHNIDTPIIDTPIIDTPISDEHSNTQLTTKKETLKSRLLSLTETTADLFSDVELMKARVYITVNGKYEPADLNKEPYKNIKAALDDIYQDTVTNFDMARPILTKTVNNAAASVGFYDSQFRLDLDENNNILVLIESVGAPVVVDSRYIDIRGEGAAEKDLQDLQSGLTPLIGDVFHHGKFDNSKYLIENTTNRMGYFDGKWLNKSADIVLPDNKADVALIYDTGERYKFDDVIFFTIDETTGETTTDVNKMPVNPELLYKLIGLNSGDNYNKTKVADISNNLAASKYFNNFSVEEILPSNGGSKDIVFNSNLTNNTPDEENLPELVINKIDKQLQVYNVDEFKDLTKDDIERIFDLALIAFPQGINDIDNSNILKKINNSNTNHLLDRLIKPQDSLKETSAGDNIEEYSSTINLEKQLTSIIFAVDDTIEQKYDSIEKKAKMLLSMPDNKVLNESVEKNYSPLGRISNKITDIAKRILPDENNNSKKTTKTLSATLNNKISNTEVKRDKKVPLYILVMSNKPHDAQVGIGYGTDTGFRITGKLDNNLINKEGYQAGISAELSKIERKVGLRASRPWSHPLKDILSANIRYEEDVNEGKNNDWKTKSLLTSIARNRYSDSGWNRNYSLRYRYDELDLSKDQTINKDALPVKFSSSNPKQQALLLGYSMNKTTADDLTNPTLGYRQQYALAMGKEGVGSDTDMVIARAGITGVYSFGDDKKHQVIGKLNGAYLWSNEFERVPYTLRFFSGGDQTIKGYDYNSLSPTNKGYLTGGEVLAIANTEYNYEVKEGLRAAIFADVGNAYDKNLTSPTKVGLGFGVRWASPVGPVRVDIAAGVTEESIPVRLHLFIGSPL